MSFAPHLEDLRGYGIIESSDSSQIAPSQGKPLRNHVHKIWSYENFSRPIVYSLLPYWAQRAIPMSSRPNPKTDPITPLPREIYDRLLPALRLATLMLRHSLYFFHTVRNAKIIPAADRTANARANARANRRARFDRMDPAVFNVRHTAEILAQLDDMAGRMYFVPQTMSRLLGGGGGNIASTGSHSRLTKKEAVTAGTILARDATRLQPPRKATTKSPYGAVPPPASLGGVSTPASPTRTGSLPVRTKNPSARPSPKHAPPNHLIGLPGELFRLLSTPHLWNAIPAAAQHRVFFQFAVTLVHELAHSAYFDRRKAWVPYDEDEVYFDVDGDAENELGFAWEQWMFGALVIGCDGEVGGGTDWARCADSCPCGGWPTSKAGSASSSSRGEDSESSNGGVTLDESVSTDEWSDARRPQSNEQDIVHDMLLPTYAVCWQEWHHSKSHLLGVGTENRRNFIDSTRLERWFDRDSWAVGFGAEWKPDQLEKKTASKRKNSSCHSAGSKRSKTEPLCISLTPMLTRIETLYNRGPEDHRPEKQRELGAHMYRDFMTDLLLAAQGKDEKGNTLDDPWKIQWGSEYSDDLDSGASSEYESSDTQSTNRSERSRGYLLPGCARPKNTKVGKTE